MFYVVKDFWCSLNDCRSYFLLHIMSWKFYRWPCSILLSFFLYFLICKINSKYKPKYFRNAKFLPAICPFKNAFKQIQALRAYYRGFTVQSSQIKHWYDQLQRLQYDFNTIPFETFAIGLKISPLKAVARITTGKKDFKFQPRIYVTVYMFFFFNLGYIFQTSFFFHLLGGC